MRITRTTIAGIVAGIILLAVIAGYAIGLPKADDSDELPSLPDHLGDLVALSVASPTQLGNNNPQAGAAFAQATPEQAASAIKTINAGAVSSDDKAAAHLARLYGDATMRSYIDGTNKSQGGQLAVTVVDGHAGMVIPGGPAETVSASGVHYDLKRMGAALCAGQWQEPQAASAQGPATGVAYGSAECRIERDGLTYDAYGSGLSLRQVRDLLQKVVDAR